MRDVRQDVLDLCALAGSGGVVAPSILRAVGFSDVANETPDLEVEAPGEGSPPIELDQGSM